MWLCGWFFIIFNEKHAINSAPMLISLRDQCDEELGYDEARPICQVNTLTFCVLAGNVQINHVMWLATLKALVLSLKKSCL